MQKLPLSLIFSFLCLGFSESSLAIPKNVIIIRHAEKPSGKMYLAPKGYERAAALPYYFLDTPRYNTPIITHIFATGLIDLGGPEESV